MRAMAGLNDADPETEGVTLLLERWIAGDRGALDRLLPHVYRELQKLAQSHLRRERDDHTLTPTGLVHEAYLRLFKRDLNGAKMENRTHFFALAAQSMRRVLVEHARRYEAARRVAPKDRVPLGDDGFWARIEPPPAEILALDEALEKL